MPDYQFPDDPFQGWRPPDDRVMLPRTGGYLRGFTLQTTSYGKRGPWSELWGDWPVFLRAWRRRCTARFGQDDPDSSGRLRCRRSSGAWW